MTARFPTSFPYTCRNAPTDDPRGCECSQIGYIRSLSGYTRLPGNHAAPKQ